MAWVRTTHTRNSVSETEQVFQQFNRFPSIHQELYSYNVPKGNYYDAPPHKPPFKALPRTETQNKAMEFRKLPLRRDAVRADDLQVQRPQYDYAASGKEYPGRPETTECREERGRYETASPPGGAYEGEKYIDCIAAAKKYNGVLYTDDKKRRYAAYPATSAYDSVEL